MQRRQFIKIAATAGLALPFLKMGCLIDNRKPWIVVPQNAINEIFGMRTFSGKGFSLIGKNKFAWRSRIGPIHYPTEWPLTSPTKYADVDSRIIAGLKVDAGWFKFKVADVGIGYDATSRRGGDVFVRLARIGGVSVDSLTMNIQPQVDGNVIWYRDVVPGIDIYIRVRGGKVQIFKRIKTSTAPRSFTWDVSEGNMQFIKIQHETEGWDNDDFIASRERRRIEVNHSPQEPIVSSRKRYLVTEEWTGKTIIVNDRAKRDYTFTTDVEYPVVIDQDITEQIAQDSDDGADYYVTWYDSYRSPPAMVMDPTGGNGNGLGLRFQTVNVAQGVTIDTGTNIYLEEHPSHTSVDHDCNVFGIDEDNTPTFSTGNRPSTRTLTTASTATTLDSTASSTTTIDVQAIVQEIINRGSWAANNAIGFFLDNNENTTWVGDDYANTPANSSRMDINFTAAGVTRRKQIL